MRASPHHRMGWGRDGTCANSWAHSEQWRGFADLFRHAGSESHLGQWSPPILKVLEQYEYLCNCCLFATLN